MNIEKTQEKAGAMPTPDEWLKYAVETTEASMLDFISVKEAAEKWGISERRVQKLCEEERIGGVPYAQTD